MKVIGKFNKLIMNFLLVVLLMACFLCPSFLVSAADGNPIYTFEYNGSYHTFVVPRSGFYRLEVWGAQGGHRGNNNGGKGGYAKGEVYLNRGDVLYIYVGGDGITHKGYNGGGKAAYGSTIYGGGATDIRFVAGEWNEAAGLKSRLIVGGGGGSVGAAGNAGGAGGVTGGAGGGKYGDGAQGGTLNGAGLRGGFGYGGSGTSVGGGYGGGGGGGWYGGGGVTPDKSSDDDKGGGGGSCFTWNAKTVANVPSGYSVPSSYYMTNIGYSTGARAGDGYARITALKMDGITSIEINRGEVPIDFKYNLYTYHLTVDNDVENIRFNITTDNGYILSQSNRDTNMTNLLTVTNTITLTDEETGIVQVYTVQVNKQNYYLEDRASVSYGYSYTGEYEKFYVPATGVYTIETWGAQGGHRGNNNGGKGGYTAANMYLVKGEVLYIYVGGSGSTLTRDGKTKGFNGGGYVPGTYGTGGTYSESTNMYGGGASDVRYGGNTLYHRVVVAAGGGSVGSTSSAGGAGGGTSGITSTKTHGTGGDGATQTAGGNQGGKFGQGGNGSIGNDGFGGAGGGGWYGGGGSIPDNSADDDRGGGGGSSFVFTETYSKNVPANYQVTDKNYLTGAVFKAGNASFTSPSGTAETGHGGNGYVRISPKTINGVNDLIINDGEVAIDFDYTLYKYNISILDSVDHINVNLQLNDGYSKVESYTGSYELKDLKKYVYSVDVINDITGLTVNYTITFHKQSSYLMDGAVSSYGYTYTGLPEKFIAPASGIYTLEAWGAQGGNRTVEGAKGGYSTGQIFLNKGQSLYVVVGGNGTNHNGYNGGGKAGYGTLYGGGASDIRMNGLSLYHRLLVAGGGGSVGAPKNTGGAGGGTNGIAAPDSHGDGHKGGTQTAGGANGGTFGKGGAGTAANNGYGGGGGGGWYGGGGSGVDGSVDDDSGGGGGSGFVWTSASESIVPNGWLLTSDQYLMKASTKAGNTTIPNPNGGTMTGRSGDGYVKISFSLAFDFEILVDDYVKLDKEFDYEISDYTGTLDSSDYSTITFTVTDSESILSVVGDGKQEIHVGDNTYNITITYINGAVQIFTYHIYREANDIDYLNGIYFDGHSISEFADKSFDKNTYTYNVTLPYYMDEYDLTVDKGSADQIITNIGHIVNKNNYYEIPISVTNETGTSTKTYNLKITLPHSSKLKTLTFVSSGGSIVKVPLEPNKIEYDVNLESHIAAIDTIMEMYDSEATATVTGDGYILSDKFNVTIEVTEPHVDNTIYTFHISRIVVSGYEKDFGYKGNVQTVVIPYDHEYFLQVWGAQGGKGGGRGGYSYGTIYLEKGTILYVYAGGSGANGGFNGGGTSKVGYGGGASDIRVGTDSLYSRVIIAGGGGGNGSDGCATGAVGGGINGGGSSASGNCGTQAGGGSQTAGGKNGVYKSAVGAVGKFGSGANAPTSGGNYYGGGGGGGFYGGGSGATSGWSNGGGGGSGYIYTREYAEYVESKSEWLLNSDYYLTNAATLSGSNVFESPTGAKETGHSGNGYAKITIPYQKSENNYLDGIIVNKGTITPDPWDYDEDTYYLHLNSDEVEINIEGVPADKKASVAGNGNYIIEAGTTEILLVVTAENGSTKTYTVIVTRDADTNPNPRNILINGLLQEYCSIVEDACEYEFDVNTHEYYVKVPYTIREIVMVVDKAHYFQEVIGDGLYSLSGENNNFQINVISEDKKHTSTWKYNIYRNMSGNADLKSLRMIEPEYDINYAYNITDYYVIVPKETEHVVIEAIADDPKANVVIEQPEVLDYGQNAITVTVTAANGVKKIYTIYVTRMESDNAFLNDLTITNITDGKNELLTPTPQFNKMNLNYKLEVENDVTKISLSGELEDEFASVEGLKEYDLNVGANTINVVVTAQDDSKLTYSIVVTRKANSNNLLASLSAKEASLSETFEPSKFVYYMYVTGEVEKLTIEAVPQVSTSTYTIIGNTNNLVAGRNEIIIRVKAQNGVTCDYKIIVIRTGYDDNNLLSLLVMDGNMTYSLTPNFDPLYETYTLNLSNEVTNVTITATANAAKRAKIGSNSVYVKRIDLLKENPSNNVITVTAEDGTTKTYTLVITRNKSSNNLLESLVVENHEYQPAFSPNELEYSLETNEKSLVIHATAADPLAKVEISSNAKALNPGDNEITITVTAEDKTTKTYILHVTRILSDDNTLKSLEIEDSILDPEFDPEWLEYYIDTFDDKLNITAIPNNKYAKVEIVGNDSLKPDDNEIQIIVTSETGVSRTYIVHANRIVDTNNFLDSLTASTGLDQAFNRDLNEYTRTTEDEEITITVTLESKKATYSITDAEGNIISSFPTNLKLGENIFFVNVTAQNGEVNPYKLTITRNIHSDSKLINLTTSEGLNEEFDPEIYQYTVDTKEHEITITPTVREKHATYVIYNLLGEVVTNPAKLDTGANIFMIVVTAENNTTSTYNLVVNRTKKNIATIEDLGIEVTPKFNRDKFHYSITVDETMLHLENIILTDPYSTYEITGNSGFMNGEVSVVEIKVTSEDETVTNTYVIEVTKVISTDARLGILKLDDYEFAPVFDKDKYVYEVFVPKDVISGNLEVQTLKNTATIISIMVENSEQVVTSSNKFKENVTFGDVLSEPTITIIVRAENGSENIYKINIYNDDIINNYLKSLDVDCGTLDPIFAKETNSYVVFADEATYCNVYAEPEVDIADVSGTGYYDFDSDQKYLIVTVTVTSQRGQERNYTITIRRERSSESRLATLELNGYTLDPLFSSDVYTYYVEVENNISTLSEALFTYTTIDPDSIVNFPEMKLKTTEENIYTITSTSEDGLSNSIYVLHVTRKKSSDASVISVTATVGDKTFTCKVNPISKICELTVPYDTSDFTLDATLSEGATVMPKNPSKHTIEGKEKDIILNVTAEDEITTDAYTVHVVKGASPINDLIDLQVNYTSLPGFTPSKLTYDKTVLGTMSQVMITAILADDRATIVTDLSVPFSLDYGINIIEVEVRAEDGTVKTYTINITRSDSDDTTLTYLAVKNYPFEESFDPLETKYTIRVPKSKKTLNKNEIIYTLSDPNAIISMPNSFDIDFTKPYNIYTITVMAANGVDERVYQISILSELSNNNDIDHIVIDETEVKAIDKVFTYGIFDTNNVATLTDIILVDEYAEYNVILPVVITYGEPYQFTVTAENGDIEFYTINLVKNKTSELKLLNIEAIFKPTDDCEDICTFDNPFNEDMTEYVIYVPNNIIKLDLVVTPKNEFQTYDIIGNNNFEIGENKVIVRVKNSLDETLDYEITVYREANIDPNLAGLEFITPAHKITEFDEFVYEYFVEFNNIPSGAFELNAIKKFEGQNVTLTGSKVLYFGKNDIMVHVQSESCFYDVKTRGGCNTADYVIHAYRNEGYSNLLSSLTVSSGDVGDYLQVFNKYKFDYILEVDSEISKVKVEGTAQDAEHATVTGNGDYNLKIGLNTIRITVTPEIGDPATYTLNIIRKQSDNVNLENLEVVGYTLSPAFSRNITDYYINIDSTVNSLNIKYTKESPDQTVYITGNSNFVTGENIVNVVVLSGDKTRGKTYRIHANRAASDNNLLNKIIVTSKDGETTYPLDPAFNSMTNSYTVKVGADVHEVNVDVIKGQISQNVIGTGSYVLDYGGNVVNLSVTSESGIVNNYIVTIIRDFNFELSNLTVSHNETIYDLVPEYSPSILVYNVEVDYEIDYVNVDATLVEPLNSITGLGEYTLNTGMNDITITVSYADKGSVDYVIHVYRKKCSDNTLKSLKVKEGVIDPIFDPERLNYTVDIPFEFESATVIYETNDPNAIVEIEGNTNLEVGVPKEIKVIVTAEDGSKRTYTIIATRLEKPVASNKLIDMYIDEGPLSPIFNENQMNYSADVSKNTNRVTLHLKAEEPSYTTVQVYEFGTTNIFTVDMKAADPKVSLNIKSGKTTFIIRVTNYEGSIRNYQLDIYKAGESEARIKSLSFDHGTLKPIFDRNTYSYTMEVENDVNSLQEFVTMMDENATYTITGNKSLKIGENVITITTLAQDGKTSLQYIIIVTKKASNNAYLSDIVTFPEKDFVFNKEKYNYVLHVDSSVNTVQIIGVREDPTATLTGNGIYNLTDEDLTVNLVVVAQDGTTRIYTVVVKRSKDDNANLASLTVNNGELVPGFDKDWVEYTVEVENYVETITVNGIPESIKATVTGNKTYNLDVGENKIAIVVTAEDGTTKTYYVTVIRQEDKDNYARLKGLKVVEGELQPEFNSLTFDYVVYIPYEYENATVIYETYHEDAVVDVYGNTDLEVGHNEVNVKVSYGDDSTTYTIDVIRQEPSNTYLKDLSVSGYDIIPDFERTIQEYTLDVSNDVESIDLKAIPELETSKVYIKSKGDYELIASSTSIDLEPGENEIYIKVISASNAERIYRLIVTRYFDDNNLLLTLESSIGEFTPKFDPFTNSYILNVPEGTESVTLSGTVSETATVTGLETYPVTVGSKTQYIVVTSQSGIVNTYDVTIVREPSSDASIIDIIPSIGSLEPSYTEEVSNYTMEVEGDVNSISFEVITSNKNATVTGNGLTNLFPGNNIINIIVIAEDGVTQEEVTIEVYKKTDIISFDTDEEISIPIGNDYQIEIRYNPETTDYTEMTYEVIGSNILTVSEDGLITPNEVGDTVIKVTSKRNPLLTKTITVHVINPLIETDVYIIYREDAYVTGMEVGTTIEDFISNFKNEKETLKVVEKDTVTEVDGSDIVKTKYIIQLVINEHIYDELVLVLKGDADGNGYVNVNDTTRIENYILGRTQFDVYEVAASDVDVNGFVNVNDTTKVQNYIVKTIDSLNKDLYAKKDKE